MHFTVVTIAISDGLNSWSCSFITPTIRCDFYGDIFIPLITVSGSGYSTPLSSSVHYPFSRESLRNLHLRTQELKLEVKTLRRMTQAQAINMKESIREVSDKIKVRCHHVILYGFYSFTDLV